LHEDETESSDGERFGEIVYRGPNVTMGYATELHDLAKGDEFKGVLFTGDLTIRDIDGCYYILGRLKRFLKLYGVRIGLDECEWLIANKFAIECLCSGNDEKMKIYITDVIIKDKNAPFLSLKTGLFIKAIEVIFVDQIHRSEFGKPILN